MSAIQLPPLAEFLRWLAETPEVFRCEPEISDLGEVPVQAIVADLFDTYFGASPDESLLAAFRPANAGKA